MSDKGKKPVASGRNQKRFKRQLQLNYIRYGAALLFLVVLTFFAPQMILSAQDRYQMDRIWQGTRNGLDLGKIYDEYGDMRERMEAFARRLEEDYTFYVAGTEHRMDEEFFDILDDVTRQEGYEMLLAYGMAPDLSAVVNRGYTVDEWKKYLIYNDITGEEENAVILSGWYMEFTMRNDVTVKLLVDTETHDLYYLQMVDYSGMDSQVTVSKEKEPNSVVDGWSTYGGILWFEENGYAETWYAVKEWLGFWFDYYEAGENLIQTYDGYLQSLEATGAEVFSYHEGMNYEVYQIALDLPYWKNTLKWQMEIAVSQDGKAPNRFSIGLRDVAERIEEMQENS